MYLLAERAVLTRNVCRELLDCDDAPLTMRVRASLNLLLQWVHQHYPKTTSEPYADDGLRKMVVPEGCENIMKEIRAGTKVCKALFLLTTSDTTDIYGDGEAVKKSLSAYWRSHGKITHLGALWLHSK
jgi:hypothetical protein